MPPTRIEFPDDRPTPLRLNGCGLLLVVAFLGLFVTVCTGIGYTWFQVGSHIGSVEWVVDEDPAHPGWARAMPTVDGMGDASQQLSLDVAKPYAFPYGYVSSNTTTGQFTPVCE